jgi:hypothetical protein
MQRWQLPAGNPWAAYAKYTLPAALGASAVPLHLPDVSSLDDVQRAAVAGRQVGVEGLPADTLFVLDLRGAASVAFGAALSHATGAAVSLVPTFNNWPVPGELVPAEETLAAMASMSPHPQASDMPGTTPVFLLDSWRLAYRFDDPGDGTYDNRYILTPADLPDAETLQRRGIRRVLYIVADLDDSAVEEDDLNVCFLRWQHAGIALAMVDLYRLEQPVGTRGWFHVFDEGALTVRPRATIVAEPGFYVRARGGFGGLGAQPTSVHLGGIWFDGPSRQPDAVDAVAYDGFGDDGTGWGGRHTAGWSGGSWGGGGG